MKDNFFYFQIVASGKQRARSVMIATKNTRSKPLLYEDAAKSTTRALRYAENKPTPFEDEQSGQVILSPIIFEDGLLKVEKSRNNLVQFLELHPDNVKNGGRLFKLRDFEEEAKMVEMELDIEEKARAMAREITDEQCRAIHRAVYKDTDRLSSLAIRKDVRLFAKNNPEDFLELIEDPEVELSGIAADAMEEGLISFRKNDSEIYYNLPNNKSLITRVPKGKNAHQHLEDYLKSEDGAKAFSALEEALTSLNS
jgi:hypothetical protein